MYVPNFSASQYGGDDGTNVPNAAYWRDPNSPRSFVLMPCILYAFDPKSVTFVYPNFNEIVKNAMIGASVLTEDAPTSTMENFIARITHNIEQSGTNVDDIVSMVATNRHEKCHSNYHIFGHEQVRILDLEQDFYISAVFSNIVTAFQKKLTSHNQPFAIYNKYDPNDIFHKIDRGL